MFLPVGTINSNFTSNTANYNGGVIYFSSSSTVTNCNFINNTADGCGAVHFNDDGNVTNCNLLKNQSEKQVKKKEEYGK